MKKLPILAIIAIATALAGCASTKEKEARATMQADVLKQAQVAAAAPLFKLTCPEQGCVIASLEVGNPAGAAQFAEVARVALAPHRSEATEVLLAVVGAAERVAPIGFLANAAKGIVGSIVGGQVATAGAGFAALQGTAASGSNAATAIASHIPQPGATTSTVINASGPGAAVATGGNATGSAPTTTTTTTTTTTNSNNHTTTGGCTTATTGCPTTGGP